MDTFIAICAALKDYVPFFQSLLWFSLAVVAFVLLRPQISVILEEIGQRIKKGVGFKTAWFELGEVKPELKALPQAERATNSASLAEEAEVPVSSSSSEAVPEEFGGADPATRERINRRKALKAETKRFHLAHVIEPSKQRGQLYDVFIYVLKEGRDPITNVQDEIESADFFFGKYWGNKIFYADVNKSYVGVRTSAYGPFLCLCHVKLKDGTEVWLDRFIDFEMGHAFKTDRSEN